MYVYIVMSTPVPRSWFLQQKEPGCLGEVVVSKARAGKIQEKSGTFYRAKK